MDDPGAAGILKSLAAGGATVDALATPHERTSAGIEARLVKHGRLEADQASTVRMR